MKLRILVATAAIALSAFAAPAMAQQTAQLLFAPVDMIDLNAFIGQPLFGLANANLGTIEAVDPYTGVVGVAGRHGEYALVSPSMLAHKGLTLYAPSVMVGDIVSASNANFAHVGAVLAAPHVIVVEPRVG